MRRTYLMKNQMGYTKIGFSKNPKARESTLQAEEPTIEMFALCADNVERELHIKYKKFRKRGEWFLLSEDQINDIMESYNFIDATDENINKLELKTEEKPSEKPDKLYTFRWGTVNSYNHLKKMNPDMKMCFYLLGEGICDISNDINEVFRKSTITYNFDKLKNFCCIKVLKDKLVLSFKMDESIFEDSKGIVTDIISKPSFTFDKQMFIYNESDVEYALKIAKQSYISLKKKYK